jgi:hypothetical protein
LTIRTIAPLHLPSQKQNLPFALHLGFFSRPFTLRGFHAMVVQNREIMTKAVTRHTHATHEVLHEFFEDYLRIAVREIQPSHLGQALVRFVNARYRDMLVNQSPHQFRDVMVHLVRHNQGHNWR